MVALFSLVIVMYNVMSISQREQ